jgi:hypothetical protein
LSVTLCARLLSTDDEQNQLAARRPGSSLWSLDQPIRVIGGTL